MAKNKKASAAGALPVAEPDPQAPVARVAPESRTSVALADQVAGAVNSTVRTVRDVLPAGRLPVYLAGAALAVTGILEAPALIGIGLGYEALRRWEPAAGAVR